MTSKWIQQNEELLTDESSDDLSYNTNFTLNNAPSIPTQDLTPPPMSDDATNI